MASDLEDFTSESDTLPTGSDFDGYFSNPNALPSRGSLPVNPETEQSTCDTQTIAFGGCICWFFLGLAGIGINAWYNYLPGIIISVVIVAMCSFTAVCFMCYNASQIPKSESTRSLLVDITDT